MPRKAEPLTAATRIRLETTAHAIAQQTDKLSRLQRKRDRAITDARRRGCSLRDIADAAGVSHAHVANLAERKANQ